MFDHHGIRGLSDAEMAADKSDLAYRIQDIQRRLAGISDRLTLIVLGVWFFFIYVAWRFG